MAKGGIGMPAPRKCRAKGATESKRGEYRPEEEMKASNLLFGTDRVIGMRVIHRKYGAENAQARKRPARRIIGASKYRRREM